MLSNYFSGLKMFYFESDFINALDREGVDSFTIRCTSNGWCDFNIGTISFSDVLMMIFLVNAGLLCSALLVSHMNKLITDYFNDEESYLRSLVDYETTPYEEKYTLEYKEYTKEEKEELKYPEEHTYIIDNTPDGNVIMSYNKKDDNFNFYCNNKQVKYSYLETIARKFVKSFNCEHIYKMKPPKKELKDIETKDTEETINNEKQEEKVEEKEEVKKEDSVFATFKNKGPRPARRKKKNVDKKDENNDEDSDYDTTFEGNRYKYIGTFRDFEWIRQDHKIDTTEPKKKMTFDTFKSMFM